MPRKSILYLEEPYIYLSITTTNTSINRVPSLQQTVPPQKKKKINKYPFISPPLPPEMLLFKNQRKPNKPMVFFSDNPPIKLICPPSRTLSFHPIPTDLTTHFCLSPETFAAIVSCQIMMPRLRGSSTVVACLLALWLIVFIYYEHIVPARAAARCLWGTIPNQKNVLLVADPQLIDGHTYPGRNSALLRLSQHTVDVYLKQNYQALVSRLQPDYIMFLGDYLDNGRLCEDDYYEGEFSRFEHIFNTFPSYTRGKNLFTTVPGNHDVGFGNGVKALLQSRFVRHFGTPNTVESINGVDFVFLDSPLYSSEDPAIRNAAAQFVDSLSTPTKPRILLSHIPLFRDTELYPCGPARERNPFLQIAGYQYQLVIAPDLLQELIDKVQPQLLFAGDDHDYCDITHPSGAREITVKSISMAMGIKYPAVQLLSFTAEDNKLDYDTHMCYLPQPYLDVFVYVVMAIASAVGIVVFNIKQRSSRYNYSMLPLWTLERLSSDLTEDHDGISQKVHEFMVNLDKSSEFIPLPNYTFTPRTWEKRCERALIKKKRSFSRLVKKWNLLICMKHLLVQGIITVVLYNVIVMLI